MVGKESLGWWEPGTDFSLKNSREPLGQKEASRPRRRRSVMAAGYPFGCIYERIGFFYLFGWYRGNTAFRPFMGGKAFLFA